MISPKDLWVQVEGQASVVNRYQLPKRCHNEFQINYHGSSHYSVLLGSFCSCATWFHGCKTFIGTSASMTSSLWFISNGCYPCAVKIWRCPKCSFFAKGVQLSPRCHLVSLPIFDCHRRPTYDIKSSQSRCMQKFQQDVNITLGKIFLITGLGWPW